MVERYRPLIEENAISSQEYDAAIAASREAEANVAQIQAQLEAASLQLGYTTVRAPISGRAGRAQVTEGALVSQPEGTLMTRIEQISSVYVSFAQAASEVIDLRRAIASGEIDLNDGEQIEVRLTFGNGTEYPIRGISIFLISRSMNRPGPLSCVPNSVIRHACCFRASSCGRKFMPARSRTGSPSRNRQ